MCPSKIVLCAVSTGLRSSREPPKSKARPHMLQYVFFNLSEFTHYAMTEMLISLVSVGRWQRDLKQWDSHYMRQALGPTARLPQLPVWAPFNDSFSGLSASHHFHARHP